MSKNIKLIGCGGNHNVFVSDSDYEQISKHEWLAEDCLGDGEIHPVRYEVDKDGGKIGIHMSEETTGLLGMWVKAKKRADL